jgi:hypothetical protein
MQWYLAKIVFRIHCGDGQHTPQFDEQLRLINAVQEEEAFEKARAIGNSEEDTFLNKKEKLVKWEFIDVAELHRIDELIDGVELYSKVEEKEFGFLYEEQVRKRASHIRMNIENKVLTTY